MVERIQAWCDSWKPTEKVILEWAQELMHYSQHESVWVWYYIRELLRSRDSDFAPSLGKVLNAIGIAHARKRRYELAALPAPQEVRIDTEDAAKRIADIVKIIGDKRVEKKPEAQFGFERVQPMTSDDLETGEKVEVAADARDLTNKGE